MGFVTLASSPCLVNEYVCIGYSCDLHSPNALPWDCLVKDASHFYDVARYGFLCFDREELKQPGTLYPLAAALQQQCGINAAEAFTFKPTRGMTGAAFHTQPSPQFGAAHTDKNEIHHRGGPGDTSIRSSHSLDPNILVSMCYPNALILSIYHSSWERDVDWDPPRDVQPN